MSVTYEAELPVRRDETVHFLARLLEAERARRGTRRDTRALTCFAQAVLVLRRFLDGTRVKQLAKDNKIGKSSAYDYIDEAVDVLAARAPGLKAALLAAKTAGYEYVIIDGTLIETVRVSTPGPTPGVDLWWSGKHHHHGGNVQGIGAPDGWPLWTSGVRPGREHDTNALRKHKDVLPVLKEIGAELATLGDLGYEGEKDTIVVAIKKPKGGELTEEQKADNKKHNGKRAPGERMFSLLKETFALLRRVRACPWKIGKIVAAALVLLHVDHDRTT